MRNVLDRVETGKQIKNLCKRCGITADRISGEMDISVQTVYAWFSGKKTPSIDHLIELSDMLGCPLDDIIRKEYINSR